MPEYAIILAKYVIILTRASKNSPSSTGGGWIAQKQKEHLFDRTIYGIIESVERIIIGERADLHEKNRS